MTERRESEQEIDLSALWRGIRRRLPWILGSAALVGAGTYLWSKQQPTVYSASAYLISSNGNGAGNSPLDGGIVRASPLPDGAIPQALQSTQVMEPLLRSLRAEPSIPLQERERLISDLTKEMRAQKMKTISLTSRLEQYNSGSGIYTISAKARTAEAAAKLANLTSRNLLTWDKGRALENLNRAEAGFRAQLAQTEQQIAARPASANDIERQTLLAKRASVLGSLSNILVLKNSVAGVLSPLSDAVVPLQPDSPKPLRNAVLAGLLTLLLGGGIAALRTLLDRTIRSEDDVLALGLPTLTSIPRLRQRDVVMQGIVRAARQAGLYEAIGFLRVNLLGSLKGVQHPVVMLTSTAPGEGKSSLTAALADGFASSGQRVLIIDADLRRGTQEAVWQKFNETGQWRQLTGSGGARTTREALLNPDNVQVLQVEENVDMLPAGQSLHDSLSIVNQANFDRAFGLWKQQYDLVIIDSAPLLALADGLMIGKHVDGVVMVAEFGRTDLNAVKSALRRAERGGLKILGIVINKANVKENEAYGYSYAPRREVKA
ncbi:hypothetical protein Dxin01_03152 [Deinococcus xinjiangensis]|uniref:Succinoglycan biosynthesis protein exop n=1 Tax=Deinococcus xinjiangensis TaxID=457454 RepID=A0ABP9VFP7_9DEIO